MRALRFAAGLIVALLLHLLLVGIAPRAALLIDPFLLLIVFNARDGHVVAAVLGGCVAGLAEDTVSNGLFGLYGMAGTVVGYVAARAAQMLSLERRWFVAGLFCLAAILQQIVIQLLFVTLAIERPLPAVSMLAVRVLATGVLGTTLAAGAAKTASFFAAWKESRKQRLSWEYRE